MNNIAALILAGGKGQRMGVLCHSRPKPALPFAGNYRVIDFALSNCVHSGIGDIAVLTDYRRAYLADYIARWRAANSPRANLRALEPGNGCYAGTADAVFQNLDVLEKTRPEAVLVLAADHVYKLDYRRMLEFHRRASADITVGVVDVPPEQAFRFGTVDTGDGGRITGFFEKSSAAWGCPASMGVYVFNREILARLLTADAADAASCHDFGYSVLPRAVSDYRMFAFRFDGYWRDVGTVSTYYETSMDLLRARPRFRLGGRSPVLTQEQFITPSCISRRGDIVNSLVSPGCIIRGRVENSVLSPRVWVAEGAVVRDSIIMGDVFIGRDSIVDGCILDEGVKIGGHSYIGLGHVPNAADENITVLAQGTSVPPDTIIEHKRKVSPERVPAVPPDGVLINTFPVGDAGAANQDISVVRS